MSALTKAVSIAASVILSFSLFACGNRGSATSTGSTETQSTEQEAENEKAQSTEILHGTINGNTYNMPFFGFTYTIDDDMYFADDERLSQLSDLVADTTKNDNRAKYLERAENLFDMYAEAPSGKSVRFIILNDKSDGWENVTVEQVRAGGKQGIRDSYSSLGITNSKISDTIVTVEGQELLALDSTGKLNDLDVYERTVYFNNGEYFGTLSFTAANETELDAMKDGITLL